MKKLPPPPPPVLLVLVLVCMASACDGTFVNYLLGTDHSGGSGSGGIVLPPGNPRTLYVAQTATGSGDGSSWANTSGDLQEMIDYAAVDGNNIDEIWVKAGIYKPIRLASNTDTVDPGNRNNSFVMRKDVKIYGGFEGYEAVFAQRDWKNHPTTLSGDFDGNDSPIDHHYDGTFDENAYSVVWSEGLTLATVLDGFTISGGNAAANGGGIMCENGSSPILANLVITGNFANNGGGIMCENGSSPTLTNVTIIGNAAWYGGGIMCRDGSSPTLTNVILRGNTSGAYGGGMYNYVSSPTLTNVIVAGNEATYGGGILNIGSLPTLTNVTISGNHAGMYGGGMDNYTSYPIIRNSIIWGNGTGSSGPNVNNSLSTPEYWNTLLEGSGASWDGAFGVDNGGNIADDPQFSNAVDASQAPTLAGDYRLNPGAAATAGMGSNYFDN